MTIMEDYFAYRGFKYLRLDGEYRGTQMNAVDTVGSCCRYGTLSLKNPPFYHQQEAYLLFVPQGDITFPHSSSLVATLRDDLSNHTE